MALRVNIYGMNNTQKVKLYAKTPAGKQLRDVYVHPFEVVIYTTLGNRGAKGIMEYDMSFPNFKFNGLPSSAEAGDVVTKKIHYINLLKMSVDNLDKSALKFIQGVYLYKFKKNIKLIKKEDFFTIIQKIETNLEKLDGKAHEVAIKIYTNLLEDLYNIMSKDKVYYKKEIDFMEYGKNTYADRLIEQGITQGITQGRLEGITQGIT